MFRSFAKPPCHTSQMVGKPDQTIRKANLQHVPAFGEPFSKISIDCVGRLLNQVASIS